MKLREDMTALGVEMHSLLRTLFPICRSITGNGVRQTLNIIKMSKFPFAIENLEIQYKRAIELGKKEKNDLKFYPKFMLPRAEQVLKQCEK